MLTRAAIETVDTAYPLLLAYRNKFPLTMLTRDEVLSDPSHAKRIVRESLVACSPELDQEHNEDVTGLLFQSPEHNDGLFLVDEKTQALVASIAVHFDHPQATSEVLRLCVEPAWRNRGIGVMLLAYFLAILEQSEAFIRNRGFVELVAVQDAMPLYKRLGFRTSPDLSAAEATEIEQRSELDISYPMSMVLFTKPRFFERHVLPKVRVLLYTATPPTRRRRVTLPHPSKSKRKFQSSRTI